MGKRALATTAKYLESFFNLPAHMKTERLVRLNGSNDNKLHLDNSMSTAKFFDLKTMLIDRAWCETDPDYVQFIPYVTIVGCDQRNNDEKQILTYVRGEGSGESRLKQKLSIGIGGHVEDLPNLPDHNLYQVLLDSAYREIQEELGDAALTEDVKQQVVAGLNSPIIYLDTRTPTESVHLGIFLTVYADIEEFKAEHNVIDNLSWTSFAYLKEQSESGNVDIEPWSQKVLMMLRETDFVKKS